VEDVLKQLGGVGDVCVVMSLLGGAILDCWIEVDGCCGFWGTLNWEAGKKELRVKEMGLRTLG